MSKQKKKKLDVMVLLWEGRHLRLYGRQGPKNPSPFSRRKAKRRHLTLSLQPKDGRRAVAEYHAREFGSKSLKGRAANRAERDRRNLAIAARRESKATAATN